MGPAYQERNMKIYIWQEGWVGNIVDGFPRYGYSENHSDIPRVSMDDLNTNEHLGLLDTTTFYIEYIVWDVTKEMLEEYQHGSDFDLKVIEFCRMQGFYRYE
tara:strand:+ start:365 stop:670 length:306 start_codon:yes stop_codon:yes gene_type:complete